MATKVMIPTALRQFASNRDTMDLDGENVGEVLQKLANEFPELKRHLFDDGGQLRNFVNVFLNDQNIRDLDNQQTPLNAGDELTIVPAVAGGTCKQGVSRLIGPLPRSTSR